MKAAVSARREIRTIKQIDRIERPREKLIRYGVDRLTDAELLAIILRNGQKGKNVVALAEEVLNEIGLTELPDQTLQRLQKIPGIGMVKACEILACCALGLRANHSLLGKALLTPKEVWTAVASIHSDKKEHFVALYLDSRQQLIRKETISVGTVNASLVHPREVFEPAIRLLACQVIVAHNHPSGEIHPSSDDINVTERLKKSGEVLGIELIDHVIVTARDWWSMREHGWNNSQ